MAESKSYIVVGEVVNRCEKNCVLGVAGDKSKKLKRTNEKKKQMTKIDKWKSKSIYQNAGSTYASDNVIYWLSY